MDLHQIQITYQLAEDRILLRVSFKNADEALQETRAWLTRRLVNNFWQGMVRALETQVRLDRPQAAHASTELVGIEHQAVLAETRARGDFDKPFETPTPQDAPVEATGPAPLLVHTVRFTLQPGQATRMHFAPAEGEGFEMGLTAEMMHAFCALLQAAVNAAEWNLDLHLPVTAPDSSAERVLN